MTSANRSQAYAGDTPRLEHDGSIQGVVRLLASTTTRTRNRDLPILHVNSGRIAARGTCIRATSANNDQSYGQNEAHQLYPGDSLLSLSIATLVLHQKDTDIILLTASKLCHSDSPTQFIAIKIARKHAPIATSSERPKSLLLKA